MHQTKQINKNAIIKEIKERQRKQDHSLKLMFCPEQFFIGNHHSKLISSKPITIEQNSMNRLCIRFFMAGDPMVGYNDRDFGIALTQIEHIWIKDEEQENPPVLVCTLNPSCFERMCKVQTGLKDAVEKPFRENTKLARSMTFILKSWNDDPDSFVKICYNDLSVVQEHHFDFEMAKSIMLNEVRAVYQQSVREQQERRHRTNSVFTDKVSEMNSRQWAEYLADHKLKKNICKNGSIYYDKVMDNPLGRRQIKVNSEEYEKEVKNISLSKPHLSHIDQAERFAKKRKLKDEDIKRIRWNNRHGWVAYISEQAIDNLVPQAKTEYPTIAEVSMLDEVNNINATGDSTTDFENLNYFLTPKDPEEFMNFDQLITPSVLQPQNGLKNAQELFSITLTPNNTGKFYSVEATTDEMKKLGDSAYNVDMTDFSKISVESWQCNQNQQLAVNIYPPFSTGSVGENASSIASIRSQGSHCSYATCNQETTYSQDDLSKPPSSQNRLNEAAAVVKVTTDLPCGSSVSIRSSEERIPHDTQLFIFPPPGKGVPGMDAVILTVRDVRTLDRKEFLIDNVMTFMLNYISCFMIERRLLSRIHMCNTFFYVNLTRQLSPLCFSMRKAINPDHEKIVVKNCTSALRWTRKFDVFDKDYIIMPINEDLHWLVIAIINPSGAIVDMSNEESSRSAPKCYIVFFDPLSGLDPSKRNHMCHCIKIYLRELYAKTKAPGMKFAPAHPTFYDQERVVVVSPKNAPIQDNFYDCGLYALHFIEGLFCYPRRPVNVNDLPDFDWSKFYPEANMMCDLMRDKIYNLILQQSDATARSRLSQFEREVKSGREGTLRKSRHHSAVNLRRLKRHRDYCARHYSLNPPSRNLMTDDPTFLNPRALAEMPITQLVRRLRIPEENFPIAY